MKKYIITFGSGQLQMFNGNSMDVMLVIEADSEAFARDMVRRTEIGNNFCTSYPYTDEVVEEFIAYGMKEYTLEDLGLPNFYEEQA